MLKISNSFFKSKLDVDLMKLEQIKSAIEVLKEESQIDFKKLIADLDLGDFDELHLLLPPKGKFTIQGTLNKITVNVDYSEIESNNYSDDGDAIVKASRLVSQNFCNKYKILLEDLEEQKDLVRRTVSCTDSYFKDFKEKSEEHEIDVENLIEHVRDTFDGFLKSSDSNITGFWLDGNFLTGSDRVNSNSCNNLLSKLFWETFDVVYGQ